MLLGGVLAYGLATASEAQMAGVAATASAVQTAGAAATDSAVVADSAARKDSATLKQIDGLYRTLIEAENRHDEPAVRKLLWESANMLFVAKTATAAEGNWAGFWGTDVVMQHLHDLYQGSFVMAPDYARVKTVALSVDIAETYAPLNISVGYAGQTPVPKPFRMIVTWVHTPTGWKMATDIALPIPPVPAPARQTAPARP